MSNHRIRRPAIPWLPIAAVAVILAVFPSGALAGVVTYGFATPQGFDGTGARYYDGSSFADEDVNVYPGGVAADPSSVSGTGYEATSTHYSLTGEIDYDSLGHGGGFAFTGGFYRDEMYFTTTDGLAAELQLEFLVDADITGGGKLLLSWGIPDSGAVVGFQPEFVTSTASGQSVKLNSNRVYSQGGVLMEDTYQFTSGSYIPFTFAVWGQVFGTGDSVEWLNTVQLVDVRAIRTDQTTGAVVVLDDTQFSLSVESGNQQFPGNVVPLPSAAWLIGAGLIGLALTRRVRRRMRA